MSGTVELGVHEPRASVGPTRGPSGVREDGRLLSSIEQFEEAVRWMLTQAEKHNRPDVVIAEIRWARRDPSSLRVTVDYETTPTAVVIGSLRTVVEIDKDGRMVEHSAEGLVREARAEAAALLHRGHETRGG